MSDPRAQLCLQTAREVVAHLENAKPGDKDWHRHLFRLVVRLCFRCGVSVPRDGQTEEDANAV